MATAPEASIVADGSRGARLRAASTPPSSSPGTQAWRREVCSLTVTVRTFKPQREGRQANGRGVEEVQSASRCHPALPVHTRLQLLSARVPVHVANLLSINTECRASPRTCVPLPSGTTRLEDFPL